MSTGTYPTHIMTAAAQLLLVWLRLLCGRGSYLRHTHKQNGKTLRKASNFYFFAVKHPRLKNALFAIRNPEFFPEGSLVLV